MNRSIEILAQTPATVNSLLGGLSDDWTLIRSDENEWNPHDVIGHLIHADETNWIPRAEVILAQDENRNFPPFDRFGHFEKSQGKTLSELLERFAAIRQNCLETLRSWELSDEQLRLGGIHPEFGEVSLSQLLATWTVHDLTHIRQIATVLAKHYSDAVGPWRAYLSILR